jgi:Uma2 family endonuclease
MATLEIPNLPMAPEEFDALPEVEGVRFELVEGNLLVMNAAYAPWHSKMITELINWFGSQGRPAYSECGIRLSKNRRTCDIGVFRQQPPLRAASHDATAFTAVVEVVSEESRMRDHLDKPREYAEAGIPEYWIVDEHPTDEADGMVSRFRLELTGDGARYQLRERVGVRELTAGRG